MTQIESNSWPRTLLAAAFVGAALVAEHAVLYDEQAMRDEPELTLFASNVLGVATIGGGVLLAAPDLEEAARFITIAGIAGSVVVTLRIIRRELRRRREASQVSYQAIGVSRGVRQYGQPYSRRDPAAGGD